MYAIKIYDDCVGNHQSISHIGYFIGYYTHQGERFLTYAHKTDANARLIKLYKSRKRAEKAIECIKTNSSVIGIRCEVEEWSDK